MDNYKNESCIGHPITNALMRAACASDMGAADHADHGAVADLAPDCGACPGDRSICESACRLAEESPVTDLARVEGKVDMLLSHFGLLNTGS
jgi:hypothetical protein